MTTTITPQLRRALLAMAALADALAESARLLADGREGEAEEFLLSSTGGLLGEPEHEAGR